MANYFDIGIAPAPFVADTDLTTHQFKLMIAASTWPGVTVQTSACGIVPIGVLQNDPSTGQEATVVTIGWCKAKIKTSNCILTPGKFLYGGSAGFFEPWQYGATGIGASIPMGRYGGPTFSTADASLIGNVFFLPQLMGASTVISSC